MLDVFCEIVTGGKFGCYNKHVLDSKAAHGAGERLKSLFRFSDFGVGVFFPLKEMSKFKLFTDNIVLRENLVYFDEMCFLFILRNFRDYGAGSY